MTEPGRARPGTGSRRRPARPRACLPALVCLAAGLAGCASTPQTRELLAQRPTDIAPRAEITSVPFFPQERYQCGPAALATVLTYAGAPERPAALVDEVYIPARQGSLRTEMRAAVRARGLVPYPLEPDIEGVLREVAAGHPVLVMQNLGLDWYPKWHYAVVVGYDLEAAHVILRSGTRRRLETQLSVFERTWTRSGHWAQVVTPPDEIPATAQPLPWLQSVRELESARPAAADRGYRAATERWPNSAEAWMAQGNAAYGRDDANGARAAFTRAVESAPERIAGWNNLAYALAATGCDTAARRAARCAVALAPDDPGPRDTLDEIHSMTRTDEPRRCGIPECPAGEQGTTDEHGWPQMLPRTASDVSELR